MAKSKKLLEKLRNNPKNVSFDELRRLLEAYGFMLRRSKGSHHSFVGNIDGKPYTITVPFNRPIKPIYVKQVVELCQRKEAEEEKEGDEEQDT